MNVYICTMNPQIFSYKHQCVRDFAWVIASPPLLKNSSDFCRPWFLEKSMFDNEYEILKPLLHKLDDDPSPLINHIENRNTRLLGKYFETLVEFWLINSPGKELLAANVQVEENHFTIGEIDFIYRDLLTGEIIHLEAAGKFYMSSENISRCDSFIGPNTNDNLGRKLDKLLNGQVKLSQNGSAKSLLNKLGINGKITPAVLLKGYLFYHADDLYGNNITLPEHAEPKHRKGWWIRQSEKEKFFSGDKHWIILERSKWISPVYGNDYGEVLTSSQLLKKLSTYFTDNTYPLIIIEVDHSDNMIIENTRGFIVDDMWPSK